METATERVEAMASLATELQEADRNFEQEKTREELILARLTAARDEIAKELGS